MEMPIWQKAFWILAYLTYGPVIPERRQYLERLLIAFERLTVKRGRIFQLRLDRLRQINGDK